MAGGVFDQACNLAQLVAKELLEKIDECLMQGREEGLPKGEMSTGVSYFAPMKADLESRGVADLDIPVLVLGIDSDSPE